MAKVIRDTVHVTVSRTYAFSIPAHLSRDEIRAIMANKLEYLNERKLIADPLLAQELGIIEESFECVFP